jgi:hypothetical protein
MKTLYCGHAPSAHSNFTTGYGVDSGGRKWCYECCAKRDTARMMKTGRATLYLTREQKDESAAPVWSVTDWPGTLRFRAYVKKGAHNIARWRYDAWFTGPDGKQWHSVTFGDNTQIAHARRLKGTK